MQTALDGDDRRGERHVGPVRAFCFCDVEGSTRLAAAVGDRQFAQLLERHRHLLQLALSDHGGSGVAAEGDGTFAVFDDPVDALGFAARAHHLLEEEAWPTPAPIKVRVGIHIGRAEAVGAELIGYDVHITARICAAGHGQQVIVSQAVVDAIGPRLPEDLELRTLGRYRLKDAREPIGLYQLGGRGLRSSFPALRAVAAGGHQVPVPATPLLGRDDELGHLATELGRHRLVSVVAPGGAGKTRLALASAADVAELYGDGAWAVALAGTPRGQVADAVAGALGVADLGADRAGAVVDHLKDREVLLVLDSCEHLIDEVADLVDRLLQATPRVTVLATSRERLRVPGEQVFRLGVLPVPPLEPVAPLAHPAVRLFVDRVAAVRPEWADDPETAAAAVSIVRAVDGLPLAIELAAGRCSALTPAEVAARVGDPMTFLHGGARTAPVRHRSLRDLIDWSYDLLTDDEQALHRRLGLLPGAFDLATAQEATGWGDLEAERVLDGLTALVDKSLLVAGMDDTLAFAQLDTVRAHAADRLTSTGEEPEVARRLAAHLRRLVDHEDLEAAVDAAPAVIRAASALIRCGEPDLAGQMVFEYSRIWFAAGRPTLVEAAIAPLLSVPVSPRIGAHLRHVLVQARHVLDQFDELRALSAEALDMAEADGGLEVLSDSAVLFHNLAEPGDPRAEQALARLRDRAQAEGDLGRSLACEFALLRSMVSWELPGDSSRELEAFAARLDEFGSRVAPRTRTSARCLAISALTYRNPAEALARLDAEWDELAATHLADAVLTASNVAVELGRVGRLDDAHDVLRRLSDAGEIGEGRAAPIRPLLSLLAGEVTDPASAWASAETLYAATVVRVLLDAGCPQPALGETVVPPILRGRLLLAAGRADEARAVLEPVSHHPWPTMRESELCTALAAASLAAGDRRAAAEHLARAMPLARRVNAVIDIADGLLVEAHLRPDETDELRDEAAAVLVQSGLVGAALHRGLV